MRVIALGKLLLGARLDVRGWWLFDRKGYRVDQLLAIQRVRAPDGVRCLAIVLGPIYVVAGWADELGKISLDEGPASKPEERASEPTISSY